MLTDKATRRRNSDRAAITKFCTLPYAVVRGCPRLYDKISRAGADDLIKPLTRASVRLERQHERVAAAPALSRAATAEVAAQALTPEK